MKHTILYVVVLLGLVGVVAYFVYWHGHHKGTQAAAAQGATPETTPAANTNTAGTADVSGNTPLDNGGAGDGLVSWMFQNNYNKFLNETKTWTLL